MDRPGSFLGSPMESRLLCWALSWRMTGSLKSTRFRIPSVSSSSWTIGPLTMLSGCSQYHIYSLHLIRSQSAQQIDTVEVCGSSLHGPTIIFNTLERFLRNPTETSPVILHL